MTLRRLAASCRDLDRDFGRVAFIGRYKLLPSVLKDVSKLSLHTTILGHPVDFPIGIAPTSLHKMAHHDGECATAVGEMTSL
ncbi:hypothetical protein LSH36_2875g00000 [Paralvinella palmiformis]|uniref:FMN-dependent dehydrogenase domain-containing protein n=1 Tax=Paralvinella palmiformis TaxID=53620 RepID=A0AAD9IPI8_9ANNE|nr:hypothetical protein LSH36_2875g00000 [Paralvinella palmiformis]